MSDAGALSASPSRTLWRERLALAGCTLILTLALIRAPVPVDVDPDVTYQTLLYESLRLGHAWGEQFITTDGPLGALLAPGYVTGRVAMAMSWQIAGNLLLAGLLVSAAFRLTGPRRWWALALLGCILPQLPTLAPWLAVVLLGHDLIRRWSREPLAVVPPAAALGILALASLGHLLLGAFALLLVLATPRPPASKIAAGLGFSLALVLGWLVLGQSLSGLGRWIFRALPVLAQTSELLRPAGLGSLAAWAGLAALALVAGLAGRARGADDRRDFLPAGGFLLGAAWLAGKTVALQPYGLTQIFFGTVLLAGFILLHPGRRAGGAGLIVALALGGLIRGTPLLVTDAIGRLNRQIIVNVRLLAALPRLRSNLDAEVQARRAPHALPRIQAAVGDATVDVLGASPSHAMLNSLTLRLRPVPLGALVRSSNLAALNGANFAGADAPAFVLQSFPAHDGLAPGFEDAPAQLALYQHYDLQFEEKGFMLWRKKAATPVARTLVASGELAFGEPLHLPPTGTSWWLELDIPPGLLGRAWALVGEIPEPGLLVRDAAGAELRYPLLPAVTGAGFLVEPFVRGEVDFVQRQSGASQPRTTEIAVVPPPAGGWLWARRCHYRLYAVPGLALASATLSTEVLQTYRLLSRLPVGVAASFPFAVIPSEQGEPMLFAHPTSVLEFAVTGADRRVRGHFGIRDAAYQGTNATDGVDFSVEFLGSDGTRQILYHRWLDPRAEPGDRGPQEFAVSLPASRGGRLFLRTYNPPGRSLAWDWAFWSKVVIE